MTAEEGAPRRASYGQIADPVLEGSEDSGVQRGPWVMAQRWNDLLFFHWPVDRVKLRALVPDSLELDLYEGRPWVSISPFHLSHLRPRGLPALPFVSSFHELNVRTYVSLDGRPGVYFFSLDASQQLAVFGARAMYHLPYFHATMAMRRDEDRILFQSRRDGSNGPRADFEAWYSPAGPISPAVPGSLDDWLTARYSLYAVRDRSHAYRTDIHHAPWPLQPARASILRNTMATAAGIELPATDPERIAFAARVDVLIWAPQRVK